MRWDRLFADLEGTAEHLARVEADTLASELTDEAWGETSWRDLLGGAVVLNVRGVGQISGELAGVHDQLVRLRGPGGDRLVATSAVIEVVRTERRHDPSPRVMAALGWKSALRRLRDSREPIRMVLVDASIVTGHIDAIGRDFVRLTVGAGRQRVVVLDAIALVAPHI